MTQSVSLGLRAVSLMTSRFAPLGARCRPLRVTSPSISKRSVAATAQHPCAPSSSSFIAFWIAASFSSSLGVARIDRRSRVVAARPGSCSATTGAGAGRLHADERDTREARHAHHATFGRKYASTQSTISFVLAPGVKIFATPICSSLGRSSFGTMPPPNTTTSPAPRALERVDHRREQRHVRARHDREPDRVDGLLHRRRGDHLRRLMQPGVDDLVAGIRERTRDDLRAAIVTVEAGLGDEDPQLAVSPY